MSLYSDGLVSVSTGSNIVTGNGTDFIAIGKVKKGDLFTVDGKQFFEIYSVDSDTQLKIRTMPAKAVYGGGNLNAAQYSIVRNFTNTTVASLALDIANIQRKWHNREEDITGWIASDNATHPVRDVYGVSVDVVTPTELTRLSNTAAKASSSLSGFESRISKAETDLSGVSSSLNAFYNDRGAFNAALTEAYDRLNESKQAAGNSANSASTSASNALVSADKALASENQSKHWHEQAQSVVNTVGAVNKTMNFLSFVVSSNGELIANYNGVQDQSAFKINPNGELEVTI